jgi:hypothetical protein
MKKSKADSRPFAGVKFTHELTARTPNGDPVLVRYRRVPTRDGYDIEAAIFSKTPTGIVSDMGKKREEIDG